MQNIGTYATEDEAYETLNTLCIALPLTVFFTWVLDALLAAAYLKWFHPWKILLQEVGGIFRPKFLLALLRVQRYGRQKQMMRKMLEWIR